MNKKITIPKKPDRSQVKPNNNPDSWVKGRNNKAMKRLTIDVSEGLHQRIKIGCIQRGTNMADEIRRILESKFPEA